MTAAGSPTEHAGPNGSTGSAYLGLVLLGAAVGIPAALLAALFLALVHTAEGWLWDDLPDALGYSSPPWFLVVGLPVAGALIVVGARRWLPGDGGHPPLRGLSMEPTPLAHAPGVALAALGTLPFGAVLGPEMPVIALGSVAGMAVTRLVRLERQGAVVVATAGSFSAISALFGGPIVAGMLLVEAGLGRGAALLGALLPGLVAAAIGYTVFVGFGDWGGLNAPGLAVPDLPAYEGTRLADLALAVVVGILAAALIAAVHRVGARIDGLRARLGLPGLLIAGGLAVGLIAQVGDVFGADAQDVLFSGQSSVPAVVSEGSGRVVAVLVVTKLLAYAVSIGCGFRGGPIFPAVFLGVGLASLAVVWFDVSPTLAIAVGAAAGMAAQTRLLFAPLIFAALLVGTAGVDAMPAAVLASAASWLTTAAVNQPRQGQSAP